MPRTAISQKPFDLVITEEISSPAYYEKMYQHPDWPGGLSGVTVGVGYDLGYASEEDIDRDWGDLVSPEMLEAMQSAAGVHGSPAKSLAHELRGQIVIPLDKAMEVFKNRDVPKWCKMVEKALPNTDDLPDDAFGALWSLSFNRGTGGFHAHDDRNREMLAIYNLMAQKNYAAIPAQFRSMKRIWPNSTGLQHRRDHEALMFENSLAA